MNAQDSTAQEHGSPCYVYDAEKNYLAVWTFDVRESDNLRIHYAVASKHLDLGSF
jgi:diaminopimelate decarboxylase